MESPPFKDEKLTIPLQNADNWQAYRTIAECNLRMLDMEDACDVIFRCGKQSREVKAHRYILISRSCVFHALFASSIDQYDVAVPEVEPDIFKQFLRYLYSESIDIDNRNAAPLMCVSKQYGVFALLDQCTDFLDKALSIEGACSVLEAAYRSDQEDLFQRALTLIKGEGHSSLRSSGFLELSPCLVEQIIESDDLVASEDAIFAAVNEWAEAQLFREGREVTPDSKRSVLGPILTKVRFPLMDHSFLAIDVKSSGLLSDDERFKLLGYVLSPTENIKPFTDFPRRPKRTKIHRRKSQNRFKFTDSILPWQVGTDADAISFKCNTDVILLGLQLYGQCQTKEACAYKVTCYLGEDDNVMGAVVQNGYVDADPNEPVFDLIFRKTRTLIADMWYTVAVVMEGPKTSRGEGVAKQVIPPDGIMFSYRNSRQSVNGTRVSHGQIPALIYGIKE